MSFTCRCDFNIKKGGDRVREERCDRCENIPGEQPNTLVVVKCRCDDDKKRDRNGCLACGKGKRNICGTGRGFRKRKEEEEAKVATTEAHVCRTHELRLLVADSNLCMSKKEQKSKEQFSPDALDAFHKYVGAFHQTLPHDANGLVDQQAYLLLLNALRVNTQQAFAAIPMSPQLAGTARPKLIDPQAAFWHTPEGFDTQAIGPPPAPLVHSNETASELVELYAMAAARDVDFDKYTNDARIAAIITKLNNSSTFLTAFSGPKPLTAQNIFRGSSAGDLLGPYLSQFLFLPCPVGLQVGYFSMEQKYRLPLPATAQNPTRNRFLITKADMVAQLNGVPPQVPILYEEDAQNKYIFSLLRNGAALLEFVNFDAPLPPFLLAGHVLTFALRAPLNAGNVYKATGVGTLSANQSAFVNFNFAELDALLGEVTELALAVAWSCKWRHDMRVRPGAMSLYVGEQLTGEQQFGFTSPLLTPAFLDGPALGNLEKNDTKMKYALSQAYPGGAPSHPSYVSGHAIIGGACSTILKAWFDDTVKIQSLTFANDPRMPFTVPSLPVVPNPGTFQTLQTYAGNDAALMTVGSELDKLASNIAYGRDFAGIHYRSDLEQGLLLGERVAIKFLQDRAKFYNEPFSGWQLTKRNGERITISPPKC